VFAQCQGRLCFSLCHPSKELGGCSLWRGWGGNNQTDDPNQPERYFMPYGVLSTKKEEEEGLGTFTIFCSGAGWA